MYIKSLEKQVDGFKFSRLSSSFLRSFVLKFMMMSRSEKMNVTSLIEMTLPFPFFAFSSRGTLYNYL